MMTDTQQAIIHIQRAITLLQHDSDVAERGYTMTITEMQERFNAYTQESTRFTFGDWLNMDWDARNARQAEIDAKHSYKHGWITVDGHSFDRRSAFPDEQFLNVWD